MFLKEFNLNERYISKHSFRNFLGRLDVSYKNVLMIKNSNMKSVKILR